MNDNAYRNSKGPAVLKSGIPLLLGKTNVEYHDNAITQGISPH